VDAPDLRRVALDLVREPRGGRLAVILDMDATPATYDGVELIAESFARVVLVTPRDAIARDTPLLVAQGIHRRLAMRGVEVLPYQMVTDWADGAVVLRHVLTGALSRVEAVDLLALATQRAPRDALLAPLRAAGIPVRTVGDATAPRLLLSAVREGQAAADAFQG
jgi:hypothetical protein